MAKKKIKRKKVVKKKAKKSKSRSRPKPKVDPYKLLLAKINRIRERVPYIEPTGECRDPDTNEVLFRFTEAQHVLEIYREQCEMEKLHFCSYADKDIQPKAIAIGNMPMLIGFFCLIDLETGARHIGWGPGMGSNRDWAANTAGTRSLKQFLLMTFEPTWQDPEDLNKVSKEQVRKEVRNELIADGTMNAIDELKSYYGQQFERSKKDDSKGTNTKGRGRSDSKKARRGTKRDNRRSK